MAAEDRPDAQCRALVDYLSQFVPAPRRLRLERTLAARTRYVTVMLEDIYQSHNANAVIRTCECLGIQDLHVVERHNRFELSPRVLQGAAKWITLRRYRRSADCLDRLAADGYTIAAMTLRPEAGPLESLPVARPLALCFGSEEPGLSEAVHAAADHLVHVPMTGFTQSLNLSVSAALAVYDVLRRVKGDRRPWPLTPSEQTRLLAEWMQKSITCGDALVAGFDTRRDQATPPARRSAADPAD